MRRRSRSLLGGKPPSGGQSGFTLIEVLVALSILGVSLAVLLSIFLQGLDRARESKSESGARVLAQSLLSQARSTANPAIGTSDGKSNQFLWRLQVLPYGTAADRAAWQENAAQIVATVSWHGDGGMRSISLSTLRVLPKAESDSE
ncbi:MAG TPA: type II secretion system protein [Rhizomicrobium sp.]|jgi:prepilin-type N-terminal cleavage/methylation domain-containing protein